MNTAEETIAVTLWTTVILWFFFNVFFKANIIRFPDVKTGQCLNKLYNRLDIFSRVFFRSKSFSKTLYRYGVSIIPFDQCQCWKYIFYLYCLVYRIFYNIIYYMYRWFWMWTFKFIQEYKNTIWKHKNNIILQTI